VQRRRHAHAGALAVGVTMQSETAVGAVVPLVSHATLSVVRCPERSGALVVAHSLTNPQQQRSRTAGLAAMATGVRKKGAQRTSSA
jgi:hypothetical protein